MSTRPKAEGCPLCGKPAAPAHKPFCGQGCRDRDLLNWLGDAYALPAREEDPENPPPGLDSKPLASL